MASKPTGPDSVRGDLDLSPAEGPSGVNIQSWYVLSRERGWRPPTDVYETDDEIVVKVEIPGMSQEEFDISFQDRRLVIAGHRRDTCDKLGYHNMEIRYGAFRTEVRVGWPVDQGAISAEYEGGFLYVSLPKDVERHQIAIRVLDGHE